MKFTLSRSGKDFDKNEIGYNQVSINFQPFFFNKFEAIYLLFGFYFFSFQKLISYFTYKCNHYIIFPCLKLSVYVICYFM